MITQDGFEVEKGSEVWVQSQAGWTKEIIGEPLSYNPNFITKARYNYKSKINSLKRGIKAKLDCGKELLFETLNHHEVHDKLKKMGLKEEEYTIHFIPFSPESEGAKK